jgi:hypothetical protein
MFAMHPSHVVGIQPLNHSLAWMFAPITASQRDRKNRNHHTTNHHTNHRLSHGSLLAERNHDWILGVLGQEFPIPTPRA